MRYKQYRFKFYLNASHAIYINGNLGQRHPHTWELALTTLKMQEDFIQFNTLEKEIEEMLMKYQDHFLNEVEPFDIINPTLENCSNFFKEKFSEILNKNGWILLMLEVSETPTRSYIINLLDEGASENENIIETVTNQILEEIKGEDA